MQRWTTSFSSLRASTLKVEVVETFVVDLPIIRPHLLSVATMQAQTLMIVKIVCSDGIIGLGEGTTIGGLSYSAESPEGMKLTIDQYIAPILKSANPVRVPETMVAIRKAIKGNNFAKCAVETALSTHGANASVFRCRSWWAGNGLRARAHQRRRCLCC
jgi:muconate cycloisomerase